MNIDLIPRDILLLFAAAIVGIFFGAIHAARGKIDSPIWPVRLYLTIFRHRQPRVLKNYAAKRSQFTWREQFMAGAFIWFFIIFMGLVFFFGCNRKSYC
ncbi:MAG: hypothetical protein V4488_16735 [Pseudomonadota bacterium]